MQLYNYTQDKYNIELMVMLCCKFFEWHAQFSWCTTALVDSEQEFPNVTKDDAMDCENRFNISKNFKPLCSVEYTLLESLRPVLLVYLN